MGLAASASKGRGTLLGLWTLIVLAGCAEAARPMRRIDYEYLRDKDVVFEFINDRGTPRELCVVNTRGENHWFLLAWDHMSNRALGSSLPRHVLELKASPDGKFLAVWSEAEGHTWLDVLDLEWLLHETSSKHVILHSIDPYPGWVQPSGWDGSKLVVKSNMLLTHLGKGLHGRVPWYLQFREAERFALVPHTGRIIPLTARAKDPLQHFRKLLAEETHPTVRSDIQRAIDFLSSRNAGPEERK